jgi:molybdopterin molybdotransferase
VVPLDEAQARLISLADPVAIAAMPVALASGRWLASPVVAKRSQPARDLSAMDGYAVRAGDGTDWQLAGESKAGRAFSGTLEPGEAVRIFTGAAMPGGADSVIIQENVAADGGRIRQTSGSAPRPGDHVRHAGSDFAAGEVLIPAGARLSPAAIALAAMAGLGTIDVRRTIRIHLISTGDELVPPGAATRDDQIPSTNSLMIAAMLAGWPVEVRDGGIVPDTLEATRAAIASARSADIIVTIGGASVGDHDLVRPALLAEGAVLDFWKVAMRPGKPVMTGRLGSAIALGLPGNPVSAFVTAILFLKPLIAALAGAANPLPETETGVLGMPLAANGPRTDHIRARFDDGRLVPINPNDSAALKALARADALIVRAPGAPALQPGASVTIIRTP